MTKKDVALRPGSSLPKLARSTLECLPDLPAHSPPEFLDIFRSDSVIMGRDAEYVATHGRYLDARINQLRKTNTLIDERIAIAAKIADLEAMLVEIQRAKDHERWQSDTRRNAEKVQAAYDHRIAVARKETELARAEEAHIRAQRNRDAAARVAPVQADQWYAEAEARRHNAVAERQDAADLARARPPASSPQGVDAADQQRQRDLATIDHEIELERGRGNQQAVLALINLRARIASG